MVTIYILLFFFLMAQIVVCIKSYKNGLLMFWMALLTTPSVVLSLTMIFINIYTLSSMIVCLMAILNRECHYEIVNFIKYNKTILIITTTITLLCVVLAETVPFMEQLRGLFKEMCIYIVIFITFFAIKNDGRFAKRLFICVLIGMCVNILYSVLFEMSLRENPCGRPLALLLKMHNSVDMINTTRGGIDYRLQSIFGHPLSLGQYMLILYSIILFYSRYLYSLLCEILLFITPVIIFLTGSRSAYIPLLLFIVCYLLFIRSKHLLIKGTLFVIAISFIYLTLSIKRQEQLLIFTKSIAYGAQFWNLDKEKQNQITGSSMKMRFNQYDAALEELKSNPLFGKGVRYREWYQDKYKHIHPKLFGYESIVLLYLVERGIIGFILFLMIIFCMYRYFANYIWGGKRRIFLLLLYGCFLVSIFFTGIRPFSMLLLGLCSSLICKPFFDRFIINENIRNYSCLQC